MNRGFPSLDAIPFKSHPKSLKQRLLSLHKRNHSSGSHQSRRPPSSLTEMKTSFDKEALYEENIKLKGEINNLQAKLTFFKSSGVKKDYEINQKEKVIKDVLEDTNGNYDDCLDKAKDSNLVSKLKKQYNSLKREIEEKENEIALLRQNVKNSRLNEYIIENKTLLIELQKMNELYVVSMKENDILQIKLNQMNDLQSQFSKQHFIILSLQGNISALAEENKALKDESLQLKAQLKTAKNDMKRFRDKEKAANKHIIPNNSNNEYYEKQIQALNKQLNVYKEIILNAEDNGKDNTLQSNHLKPKSPKRLSTSFSKANSLQSNDLQKQISLLQTLLAEALKSKNELESENKLLRKKHSSLTASHHSNDQLNEITYILIKSFEANHVTKTVAMNKILKTILEQLEDDTQIEKSDLQKQLTDKITEVILCSSNANDVSKIDFFVKTLLNSSNNDLAKFVEIFLNVFDSVKTYSDRTVKKLLYQVQCELLPHSSYLIDIYKQLESPFISFFAFRSLLEKGEIALEDSLIEFLIYQMKSNAAEGNNSNEARAPSIFDLNYAKVIALLDMKLEKVDDEDCKGQEEESNDEIMLSDEEYQTIISGLMNAIKERMNKLGIESVDDLTEDAKLTSKREIDVHLMIKLLKDKLDLEMTNIQIYCLYNKFKLNQSEGEMISVDVFETELNKKGSSKHQSLN